MKSFEFGPFLLDGSDLSLYRAGEKISLNLKYATVLNYLVERAGEVIGKQELFEALWADEFVSDSALTQAIKEIRKNLSDSPSNPVYIKTLPKRGYQFIADAKIVEANRSFARRSSDQVTLPFRFLESFSESDAGFFFGRESEVSWLVKRVLAEPTMLIYGRSGVGKTSLLQAGLIPELKKGGWKVLFLDGRDSKTTAQKDVRLSERIRHTVMEDSKTSWVLVFDQMEQLLKAGCVWEDLQALLENPTWEKERVHLVFCIREDSLAEMNRLKSIERRIFHLEFRLEEMDVPRATQVLSKTAALFKWDVSQAMITVVVDKTQVEGKVNLPLLQMVFAHLIRDHELSFLPPESRNDWDLNTFVVNHFHHFIASSSVDLHRPLQSILSHLLLNFEKEPVHLEELKKMMGHTDSERWQALLSDLLNQNILVSRSCNGNSVVELAHESFRVPIREWLDNQKNDKTTALEMFQRAFHTFVDRGFLLEEDTLHPVLKYARGWQLSSEAKEFLGKSCLKRGKAIPEWLAREYPDLEGELSEVLEHGDAYNMAAALLSMEHVSADWAGENLPLLIYKTRNRRIQRIAVEVLCQKCPNRVRLILDSEKPSGIRGWWAFMTNLALAREASVHNVPLFYRALLPTLFILLNLAGVRVRRQKSHLMSGIFGASLGGCVAGCVSGFLFALTMGGHFVDTLPVFMLLGTFFGVVGAMAISSGYLGFGAVAHRHSKYWRVVGGLLAVNLLSIVFFLGYKRLFLGLLNVGHASGNHWIEVSVLALMILLGATVASQSKLQTALVASLSGGLAGFILNMLGGNLFIRSTLVFIEALNPDGALQVSSIVMALLNPVEGLLFGFFLLLGMGTQRDSSGDTVSGSYR